MFTIENSKEKRRCGLLRTKSGVARTPFFMPIATRGAVKFLTDQEIRDIGFEVVLGNTYHLWLRPGEELVAKAGGLHGFMHWDRSILTDSGGYQVFSLGMRAKARFGKSGVKLTEEEVEFIDPVDGRTYHMSPEKSIDIQLKLGSDVIMVLDECPPYPCDWIYAKKSLEFTTRWASRCKEYFEKKVGKLDDPSLQGKRPLLFAIVQGSVYEDLRKESARQLTEIGFDGYAIGGVAVGEPREKMYDILNWVAPELPEDKPRYLMGLGRPEEIVAAVRQGVDMFDCVIPTREGRHGRLFVWNNRNDGVTNWLRGSEILFYDTINITNEKFREDFNSVDKDCSCYVCKHYSRAYLRHLFAIGEPLAMRLASLHNLFFYYELMEKLKEN
jgi:queuine tRNA-ribosyltransferase